MMRKNQVQVYGPVRQKRPGRSAGEKSASITILRVMVVKGVYGS
jgi:hypothetical protein